MMYQWSCILLQSHSKSRHVGLGPHVVRHLISHYLFGIDIYDEYHIVMPLTDADIGYVTLPYL